MRRQKNGFDGIKETLKTILLILLAVLVSVVVFVFSIFGTFILSASSIKSPEEGLYTMTFRGDDGLETFIRSGGVSSDEELADFLTEFLTRGFYRRNPLKTRLPSLPFGCSVLCAAGKDGGTLVGRNFDWKPCRTMVVRHVPFRGYESVSTCCFDFLGFGEDFDPAGSMPERLMALAAVYVPVDGINEMGLTVADLVDGTNRATDQKTERPDLTTTSAIRLLLNNAATVEEALTLLESYDMHSSAGLGHHLAIADRSGRSVVVEYIDDEMTVTDTAVVTNHILAKDYDAESGSEESHRRYDILAAAGGPFDADGMRNCLDAAAKYRFPETNADGEITNWSLVFDLDRVGADFYFRENFDDAYHYTVGEPLAF